VEAPVSWLPRVPREPVALTAQPHLIGLDPAVQPGAFVLQESGCSLGRGAGCDIQLAFPFVSRHHAQVAPIGGRFHVLDQSSVNGTFVNGTRIEAPRLLVHHDVIGLGEPTPHLTYVDPDMTEARGPRLEYDERAMRFSLRGARVELTPNQFRLLRHLHGRRGQVCSREELAETVWGSEYAPGMDATTLDRLISTLRAALRRLDDGAQVVVVTRPGLGYELLG
jgi:hypothetical protein